MTGGRHNGRTTSGRLAGLLLAIAVLGAGALPNTASAAPNRQFLAVTCVGPKFCFAVGMSDYHPYIAQYFGKRWETVNTPTIGRGALTAVSCKDFLHCIAVGYRGSTKKTPLILRWTGDANWREMAGARPKGSTQLTGVSCPTTTYCAATGWTLTSTDEVKMFLEQWRGHGWSAVAPPHLSRYDNDNPLNGISCTSPAFCVAVGTSLHGDTDYAMALQWNGNGWSVAQRRREAPGQNVLNGVSCTTSKACTAVGNSQSDPPLVVLHDHWNGSGWALTAGPQPVNYRNEFTLSGVSCGSSTACLAVGAKNFDYGYAEFWNGHAWAHTKAPNPSFALSGVACVAPQNCYAVSGGPVMRWANGKWSTMPEL